MTEQINYKKIIMDILSQTGAQLLVLIVLSVLSTIAYVFIPQVTNYINYLINTPITTTGLNFIIFVSLLYVTYPSIVLWIRKRLYHSSEKKLLVGETVEVGNFKLKLDEICKSRQNEDGATYYPVIISFLDSNSEVIKKEDLNERESRDLHLGIELFSISLEKVVVSEMNPASSWAIFKIKKLA